MTDISEQTQGKVRWCYGSHYYVYISVPNKRVEGAALKISESKSLRKALKRAEKLAVKSKKRGDT